MNKIRIRKRDNQEEIFCFIRKKWILSTAEEVVRQSFILQLFRLGYIEGNIAVEVGFKLTSGKLLRADIVIYNTQGKAEIIVECKASNVPLTEEVFRQASRYNTHFKANKIALTNGIRTLWFDVIP
ncbi:MAG: type I restriction enzyme HsdR N-terminal domain-containing protein [Rikenellaceae bacterium]